MFVPQGPPGTGYPRVNPRIGLSTGLIQGRVRTRGRLNALLKHGAGAWRRCRHTRPIPCGLTRDPPQSPLAPERFAPTDGHGGIVGTPRSKAGEGSLARENRDAGSARDATAQGIPKVVSELCELGPGRPADPWSSSGWVPRQRSSGRQRPFTGFPLARNAGIHQGGPRLHVSRHRRFLNGWSVPRDTNPGDWV